MIPKISIIVTIYNTERYLEKCFDSIIYQTLQEIEIILVDDGSPDNGGKVCDKYAEIDSRIKVIHKTNGGICSARNAGLQVATGEYITFVDSDDWVEKNFYELAYQAAHNKSVDIFMSNHFNNDEKDRALFDEEFCTSKYDEIQKFQAGVLSMMFYPEIKGILVFIWEKLYRREFLISNNISFPNNIYAHEDIMFNLKAFGVANSVNYRDIYGYHYRIIQTSTSNKFNPKRLQYNRIALDKIYKEFIVDSNNPHLLNGFYGFVIILYIDELYRHFYFKKASSHKTIRSEIGEHINEKYYVDAIRNSSLSFLTLKQNIVINLSKYNLFALISLCIKFQYLSINIGRR